MSPPQPPKDPLPVPEHDPSLEAFNIPVQDWLAANPLHQLIVSAVVSLPSSFPSANRHGHHQQQRPNSQTNPHNPPSEQQQPSPEKEKENQNQKEEGEERTLLLQRAPHDWDPLTWEHPGGTCEPNETILQAVARELAEETGLVARRVGGLVVAVDIAEPSFEGKEEGVGGGGGGGDGVEGTSGKGEGGLRPWWRLFCFLVEVEGGVEGDGEKGGLPVVRLDPEEHCAFVWATEEDVKKGWCGDVEMRWDGEGNRRNEVILKGFEVLRERRALGKGRGVVGGSE
ncbi:NUDIX hydrolase domain-like protein [Chaetomium tenue]|uniref:NUDIX hydrolase domain-like protein n=1 Tax=Chaetomium tenue TaxID=1854479 RepID=A0ACB7P144_9PEZI|nr:NUDIX hydrolase domain-like protein [Chaetomium globosum]